MPIIRNTEVCFHRQGWMKPIFPKKKDRNLPAETGAPTEAPTEAGTARAEQQARTWRHHFFRMIATAPVVQNADMTEEVELTEPILVGPAVDPTATMPVGQTPTIDRLRGGLDVMVIQQMYEDAIERVTTLFDSPESAGRRRESEAAIDYYLTNNVFKQKIPSKVRELMIIADMVIRDVHHALPYGRGNVMVRNVDSLAGGVGTNPDDFNLRESSFKYGLSTLSRFDDPPKSYPRIGMINAMMQWTASQLFMGTTTCGGYNYAFRLCINGQIVTNAIVSGTDLAAKNVRYHFYRQQHPVGWQWH